MILGENVVAFAIGFGVFIVLCVVLAFYVLRFAARFGRRTTDQDVGSPTSDDRPETGEQN
jgi:uncharacterized membrane protein (DUF485 family)